MGSFCGGLLILEYLRASLACPCTSRDTTTARCCPGVMSEADTSGSSRYSRASSKSSWSSSQKAWVSLIRDGGRLKAEGNLIYTHARRGEKDEINFKTQAKITPIYYH